MQFWQTVPLFDDINRAGVSEMSVSIFNFALTEDSEDTRPQQRTQHAAQPEDDDESCCSCCHYVSDDHGTSKYLQYFASECICALWLIESYLIKLYSLDGQIKPIECCTTVSSTEITLPITGFKLQKRRPPCVNAIM